MATGGFADKGVKVPLSVGAFPRAEVNWSEMGTVDGDVKVAYAGSAKGVKGADGGRGVVRLHEDPSHAEGGPIGLQETWFGGIVTGKTGEEVIPILSLLQRDKRDGVQRGIGMGLRWCVRSRVRRALTRISNQGQ